MIYRCRKCKRHFHVKQPEQEIRNIPISGIVIGILALVSLGVVLAVDTENVGDAEDVPTVSTALQSSSKVGAPPPPAGKDMASQFARGLHYWEQAQYREALPWFQAAASQGHADARFYLGQAYLLGRATVQNYKLAYEQIHAAALQNQFEAQHQLGMLFRDGLGTPKSRENAYVWLNISASRGHETAGYEREKLRVLMSEDEVARAQSLTMQELDKLGPAGKPGAAAAR
jgi:TPR repeat protein